MHWHGYAEAVVALLCSVAQKAKTCVSHLQLKGRGSLAHPQSSPSHERRGGSFSLKDFSPMLAATNQPTMSVSFSFFSSFFAFFSYFFS
jgi:hypothetical protein